MSHTTTHTTTLTATHTTTLTTTLIGGHTATPLNKLNETNIKKENIKRKFGEYQNVFFTDDQFTKLQKEFPNDFKERIQRLDDYMQSKGVKYKDCLATIRNWARKEGYKTPIINDTSKTSSKAVDTSRLTTEEYNKLLRKEVTIEELIEKGRVDVI